jgi:hypothetical protein
MPRNRILPRAAVLFVSSVGLLTMMGGQCTIQLPFFPPPVRVVQVELENRTGARVDPGLLVDGALVIIDPPLARGEIVVLEVDCFRRTTLQTDAWLLVSPLAIPSENVPLVQEGFEFLCGDVVSFIFAEDAFGFFTNVRVNGFLLP